MPAKRESAQAKTLKTLLKTGDVIKTNPREGFWGCAVVIAFRERCERFNPFCLIGATPIVFRHDFSWEELAVASLSVREFERHIRLYPGDNRSRWETVLGWYDARPHRALPVIGKVDVSSFFHGPTAFEIGDATNGKWPLSGRITPHLGSEAVIAWRRIHDAQQLKIDIEEAHASHDALMERLKLEAREKRQSLKKRKN